MTLKTISLILMSIFGSIGLSAAEWQQGPVQEQTEYTEQQTCENPNCPRCHPKCRKRWKSTRFAERQFQETGWPGRRDDELSDQLSR